MSILNALAIISIVVSVSFAQNINISGIVTDTGTIPLPGAAVKLEKNDISTTTGPDGKFTLSVSPAARIRNADRIAPGIPARTR